MNNGKNILKRFMSAFGYKTQKALAIDLGMSPSDLNNRAKSGTIKIPLIEYCVQRGFSIDKWLYDDSEVVDAYPTGEGVFLNIREECMKLQEILESGDEEARNAILGTLNMCRRSVETKGKQKTKKELPDVQHEAQPQGMKRKRTTAR